MVRAVGFDMGGNQLTLRARKHIAKLGVLSDAKGRPESDGTSIGGVNGEKPRVLFQWSRSVNFAGTDLNHFYNGVDNTAAGNTLRRTAALFTGPSGPVTVFRLTLAEPLPESLPIGEVNPVRRMTIAGTTWNGQNLPKQGGNWNYEVIRAYSALEFDVVVQDLGHERWGERPVPEVGDVCRGGQVWLYQLRKGQHSDAAIQIEDEPFVTGIADLEVENEVSSNNYQRFGIFGQPGVNFRLRNVYAFTASQAPEDPVTQTLYVKGTPTGSFDNCYFPMEGGRPVDSYGLYPKTAGASVDYSGPMPKLTWAAGDRFSGEIYDGVPAVDFAPASLIGGNWAGPNWRGYVVPTSADLTGITLTLDPLSASMAAGTRVGVLDVLHSTYGEIIELEIVSGDTDHVAGVSAKPSTNLIRRGLVVGPAGLASGDTYTLRTLARIRRTGDSITVPLTIHVP
jgi:hypothetical protein